MKSLRAHRCRAGLRWLLLLWALTLPLLNPWIRGDGVGYYAYLHALLLRGDLDFQDEWRHGNPSFVHNRVDAAGHLKPDQFTATGHVANHFAVGPALLWAPFVAPVHGILTLLHALGLPVSPDGYSRPYRMAVAFGTAVYGLLCLGLSYRLAARYVHRAAARLATLAIWFGTSFVVYLYFNPSWAHIPAAFAVAWFLDYWHRTQPERTRQQWFLLGLLGGLMLDVYYLNVTVLVVLLWDLHAAWRLPTHRRKASWATALVAMGGFLAFLPTLVTRWILYGSPLTTGYTKLWEWTSPHFFSVLLSSNHGLFSWTPLVLLAVVGLILYARRDPRLGLPLLLCFWLTAYVVGSYENWHGIASFGNRFFVSLTPLFVFGLAALLDRLRTAARRAVLWPLGGTLVGALVVWNLAFVFQWGVHLIPARGPISWQQMIRNQWTAVPQLAGQFLEAYALHRQQLMQRIEDEDLQQLLQPSPTAMGKP